MTNRQLYMEKRKEAHAPEEFLAAFEDTAIVFELKKERNTSDKRNLFAGIWEINPEALISDDCELCVMSGLEPTAHGKQILVIDKGGDKDTGNRILDLMYKSGVVPCCYVGYKEKKNGIKRCILQKFDYKITVIRKMNLLVDDGHLLVTVRYLSQSQAGHEKKECSET